jgi:hypothetical protein
MRTNDHYRIGSPRAGSRESLNPPRERDPSEDAWAFAIAEALVKNVPRLTHLPPPSSGTGSDTLAENTAVDLSPEGGAPVASGGLSGTSDSGQSKAAGVPALLTAELEDGRLGRLTLVVARGAKGLSIVINVADSHVKALIISEQAALLKSLKDCGLQVASVQIGSNPGAGTALAPDREGARERVDRARTNTSLRQLNARWRAYLSPPDENDAEADGVNFKA